MKLRKVIRVVQGAPAVDGAGVRLTLHQEMPQEAERLLGLQLWLNLPAAEKMTDPKYFDIRPEDVGVIEEMMRAHQGITSVEEVLLHEKNGRNAISMAIFGR